jgi:hypothetical protein
VHSIGVVIQGATGARSGGENVCPISTSGNNVIYGENERPGRAGRAAAEWHGGFEHSYLHQGIDLLQLCLFFWPLMLF